jgi:hypothetical protein
MAELIVKLKQHTPIIHFQHYQKGATLRASELKPKLDKFLIDELKLTEVDEKGRIVPKRKYLNWFNNKEKLSLDYKVKIIDKDPIPKRGKVEIMPSTFENWILSKDLTLIISTFNNQLSKEIENNIDLFFAKFNFGKRQNKGFGCFYPDNLGEENLEKKLKEAGLVVYKFKDPLRNEVQTDTYFYEHIISKCWRRLKSGKNFSPYEKSRVFEYLSKKNLRWEKRWIKRKLKEMIDKKILPEDLIYTYQPIDINCQNTWEDNGNAEYRFGRALLGLPEHYEFRANNDHLYQVKVLNSEIERFKSPVTFKVFRKNIYALVEEIDNKIFNKNFSFEVYVKHHNRAKGKPIPIDEPISTPNIGEFSINEFLDEYFKTVGFNKL